MRLGLTHLTCTAVALTLACCTGLFAQSDDPRKPDPYINQYVSMMLLSTIRDAPYILEREVTHAGRLYTLSPGSMKEIPIAAENAPDRPEPLVERVKQYRDSRGWIREDTFEPQPISDDAPSFKPRMRMIYDADARKRYTGIVVNPETQQLSWILTVHPPNSYGPTDAILAGAGVAGSPANGTAGRGEVTYQMLTVSLGSDTMLGLSVIGIRQTATRASNGDKFEIEGWFSPELQLPILVKSDDSRHGHVERRVTKLTRTEPDASLFIPPNDYQTSHSIPVAASSPTTHL